MTVPGYGGLVYIDRETMAVMRITQEVKEMPVGFAIKSILAILDYDFTKSPIQEFVLPLKASTVARMCKHFSRTTWSSGTIIDSAPKLLSRLRRIRFRKIN